LAKFYSDIFDYRQEGDYQDFVKFEKSQVQKLLAQAEDFVSQVEVLALRLIAKEQK